MSFFCRSFWLPGCKRHVNKRKLHEWGTSTRKFWVFECILNNFRHFGVLWSFARHKSSWTWIRESITIYARIIWRVWFRTLEFDCRPLEEEERQDLIEGLKTKWEQAPRMTFGDICPLKPDNTKPPVKGTTNWNQVVYSNRFQSSRHIQTLEVYHFEARIIYRDD